MDIGARIKQKRTQAGLTQVQLGKLCKVGQSAIANIESGQNPSNALLLCIASALKVDPSYLLTGAVPLTSQSEGTAGPTIKKDQKMETLPIYERVDGNIESAPPQIRLLVQAILNASEKIPDAEIESMLDYFYRLKNQ